MGRLSDALWARTMTRVEMRIGKRDMAEPTKTILAVDSDQGVGDLLAIILEGEGYEVAAAPSLEEAKALLVNSHFDLIITEAFDQSHIFTFDRNFVQELRSSAGTTPIILLSTYVAYDTFDPGEYGLAAVVPKPFDVDDLLQKVRKLLGGPKSGANKPGGLRAHHARPAERGTRGSAK
ncbi:MAG: response regulator [Dehalococcoidales bacterium]|nr:response regulator [Dehalococcoidales bacterium]